jgi:tRNA (Thr-GGU) A37 N-methylase
MKIEMNAIGVVQNEVTQQTDLDWGKIVSGIYVREELGDGLRGLDVINGTPVLDIKPYYPVYDKRDATTPEWVDVLMKEYF